ncbi:NusG domain II-containing protein [bacterium]|nr:NusG domain II-containing protein [bacterium]
MDFKRINLKFPRIGDFVVIGFIAAISVFMLYARSGKATAKILEITVDGNVIVQKSLPIREVFTIEGVIGEMEIGVKGDTVQVLSSSCPQKICVKMGKIIKPGEIIVCVPNKAIISIKGSNGKKDVDVISR